MAKVQIDLPGALHRRTMDGDWMACVMEAHYLDPGAAVIPTWMWLNHPDGYENVVIPSGTIFARKRENVRLTFANGRANDTFDPAWYPLFNPIQGRFQEPPDPDGYDGGIEAWREIYGYYNENSVRYLGSATYQQQWFNYEEDLENPDTGEIETLVEKASQFQIGLLYEPINTLPLRGDAAMVTKKTFRAYAERLPQWEGITLDNKNVLHNYFELIHYAEVL